MYTKTVEFPIFGAETKTETPLIFTCITTNQVPSIVRKYLAISYQLIMTTVVTSNLPFITTMLIPRPLSTVPM